MPVERVLPEVGRADLPAMRGALLDWYAGAARALPWRAPPRAAWRTDAYRVWLSEIMLQQTGVAAVAPYFARFVERWPTLRDLAAADAQDVLAAWAGLGYYSRARNLIACAAAVVERHDGIFPRSVEALRALPGIGDYSAAAIAAIAYGTPGAVPVDANIERVVARLFAIATPLPAGRRAIRAAATALWPEDDRGGDFAQALMDLGSRLCTARAADCAACPLARWCAGSQAGIALLLPVKPARRDKPTRRGRVSWIARDGAVWLVRRPPGGLLGGMRALPGDAWGDALPPPAPGSRAAGALRHVFTHFALDLTVDVIDDAAAAVGEGEWWPVARLDAAGLPTLYRRAAALALGE